MTDFSSEYLLFKKKKMSRQIILLFSMLRQWNTFYFSISMPVFIIDKETLYISGTSFANVSRCFFQIIIRTYVHVVLYMYSFASRKAFDIQRFKSNKNVPSIYGRAF